MFVQDMASFSLSQHAAGSTILIEMHPWTLLPFFFLPVETLSACKNNWQQMSPPAIIEILNVLFSGTYFIFDLFVFVFVAQLNSLHSELATQMADSMVFPLIQFREKDLTGRATISNVLYTHIPI